MFPFDRHLVLRPRALRSAMVLACALAAGGIHAQTHMPPANHVPEGARNDRAPTTPRVQHQGDVAYVVGGVGDLSEAQTRAFGRDMNLQMIFAQRDGHYLAEVDVAVTNSRGNTVLDVDASGPLLYAQLPPGRYEVTATRQGEAIRRSLQVPAQGRHTERLMWSDRDGHAKAGSS